MQSLLIPFNRLWARVSVSARGNDVATAWQAVRPGKPWNVFESVQSHRRLHDPSTARPPTLEWANGSEGASPFDRVKAMRRDDSNEARLLIHNEVNDSEEDSQARPPTSWGSKRDPERLPQRPVNRHLVETPMNYSMAHLKPNQLCSNQLPVWHFHLNSVEVVLGKAYYCIGREAMKVMLQLSYSAAALLPSH